MKVRLIVDEYSGTFQKQDVIGRWRTVGTIGNAGVAEDFISILQRLGHKVEIVETTVEVA